MSGTDDPAADLPAPIISATSVVKTYDSGEVQVTALSGLDIEIRRGEMIAIMGASGCGKTTLLNCLSGIDEINEGRILIEGNDLATMTDRERTRYRAEKMGFIFQSYNLLPVLTAVENVELPLLVANVNAKLAREKALEALRIVGLEARAHHKPTQLSGGQQQRVTIARSLVNDPVIVWADEPTGNLDKTNTEQVMQMLRRLNTERDQTYVIVTHDPAVGKMCDRVVYMKEGRITADNGNGYKLGTSSSPKQGMGTLHSAGLATVASQAIVAPRTEKRFGARLWHWLERHGRRRGSDGRYTA